MSAALEEIFASTTEESLTLGTMLGILGTALLLGLLISLCYLKTHEKEGYQPGFLITLIMLPAIISVIILLIGNNVARAFSLAGAFSLIRFRSAPGDPKDIAYIFFTLAVGLACGMGYLAYGAVFGAAMCLVMMVLHYSGFGQRRGPGMQLKITVPEDLNFQELFDDVLREYTTGYVLRRIRTAEFGSLFELVYAVDLKPDCDRKQMIDALRCRNGNLNIVLTMRDSEEKSLA
jgi:hypothetical protein